MTLHNDIANQIITHYGEKLSDTPKHHHDALTVALVNDVVLEIRMLSAEEYSFQWQVGEKHLRIDTAPLHPELSTFPNHLHHTGDELKPDPCTRPGDAPWSNVKRVLDTLLENPLLD